jgi:hypothetical protein
VHPKEELMEARALIQDKNVYAILVIPGDDPRWAGLLQHAEDGSALLFSSRDKAFSFALECVNDPWQIVDL